MLQQTHFIKSAAAWTDLPPEGGKEVAFWGRSNSGKSSTLNTLCQQNALARTSRTPGRTMLLNFFEVIPNRWLVDLPGYGYAKTAKHRQEQWDALITEYIEGRHSLNGIVLIMDIRHPLTDLDQHVVHWITSLNIPLHIVLNKADKIGYGAQQNTLHSVQSSLKGMDVSVQTFSAHNKHNLEALDAKVLEWLALPE
jgi:GTP-binding protein